MYWPTGEKTSLDRWTVEPGPQDGVCVCRCHTEGVGRGGSQAKVDDGRGGSSRSADPAQ